LDLLVLAAGLVAAGFMAAGCQREAGPSVSVVTSTTMIKVIVEEVAGPTVKVQSLVPGGMCPGHFDIKPKQMQDIERADLFLHHGWEEWLPKVTEAVGAGTHVVQIDIEENWMTPDTHIEAIHWIRDLMISLEPGMDGYYKERALRYENEVLKEAQSVCEALGAHQATPVICSELQSDFLTWAGFDILGTYGRAESLSPRVLEDLIQVGRQHQVRLVIDNKQSGPSVGKQIAEEIDAGHVVLTNFPEKGSYLEALRSNVEAITASLK
jgi:zinc transport system substrate-binding protein